MYIINTYFIPLSRRCLPPKNWILHRSRYSFSGGCKAVLKMMLICITLSYTQTNRVLIRRSLHVGWWSLVMRFSRIFSGDFLLQHHCPIISRVTTTNAGAGGTADQNHHSPWGRRLLIPNFSHSYLLSLSHSVLKESGKKYIIFFFFLHKKDCREVLVMRHTSFVMNTWDRFLSVMLKRKMECLGKPVPIPFPAQSLLMSNSDWMREGDLLLHRRYKSFLSIAGQGPVAYIGETAVRKCRGICYGRACPAPCLQKDTASSWWASYCTDGNEPIVCSFHAHLQCARNTGRDRINHYMLLYISFSQVFFVLVCFCFAG